MNTSSASAPHTDRPQRSHVLPDALELGAVTLTVRDVEAVAAWYAHALGFVTQVDAAAGRATVSDADGHLLIELLSDPQAQHERRHAGLYHIALNTSDRAELARMVRRLAVTQTPITGASDHGTHEALYLNDAEGNGLELAVDRAPEMWGTWGTDPLDVDDLLATIDGEAYDETHRARDVRVGHLHLQTGDLVAMRDFYAGVLGFDVQFEMPTAVFMSAGGYHHHLGFNTWIGAGAPNQTPGAAGLHHFRIHVPSDADVTAAAERLTAASYAFELHDDGRTIALVDPAGLQLHISSRRA